VIKLIRNTSLNGTVNNCFLSDPFSVQEDIALLDLKIDGSDGIFEK